MGRRTIGNAGKKAPIRCATANICPTRMQKQGAAMMQKEPPGKQRNAKQVDLPTQLEMCPVCRSSIRICHSTVQGILRQSSGALPTICHMPMQDMSTKQKPGKVKAAEVRLPTQLDTCPMFSVLRSPICGLPTGSVHVPPPRPFGNVVTAVCGARVEVRYRQYATCPCRGRFRCRRPVMWMGHRCNCPHSLTSAPCVDRKWNMTDIPKHSVGGLPEFNTGHILFLHMHCITGGGQTIFRTPWGLLLHGGRRSSPR